MIFRAIKIPRHSWRILIKRRALRKQSPPLFSGGLFFSMRASFARTTGMLLSLGVGGHRIRLQSTLALTFLCPEFVSKFKWLVLSPARFSVPMPASGQPCMRQFQNDKALQNRTQP